MKPGVKIFLAVSVLIALDACKKSATTTSTPSYNTGTYVAYREVDTVYSIPSDAVAELIIKTPTADTTYTFTAQTANRQISAGTPPLNDTLVFTSSTNGYFKGVAGKVLFIYSPTTNIIGQVNGGQGVFIPGANNLLQTYTRTVLTGIHVYYKRP